MSSATSIKRTAADKPRAAAAAPIDDQARDVFRPWHFFVLASLIAATAAVIIAREARAEHLVLISLTIGAAGFAAAALYRTLAPLVGRPAAVAADQLSHSMRGVLEREKLLVLRSIKELEFDRAMGKVSSRDFDDMAGRLRTRAMTLMRQLDSDGGAYRELIERELSARLTSPKAAAAAAGRPVEVPRPPRAPRERRTPEPVAARPATATARVCSCGTENDPDAAFCKRCGLKLEAGAGA